MDKRHEKPQWVKRSVERRIFKLLDMAKQNVKSNEALTKRYVTLARSLSTRYNVRIPRDIKRHICKKCNLYLIPGFNQTLRKSSKSRSIIYRCMHCGAVQRLNT